MNQHPSLHWGDQITTWFISCLYTNLSFIVVTPTVRGWSEETEEALRDCFETTVWEELCDPHGEDIDSLTDCITDYINLCVSSTTSPGSVLT